jgi:hypothetical protein
MPDLRPLSGEQRKPNFEAVRSVDGPTETSGHLDLSRNLPTHWLEHHGQDN